MARYLETRGARCHWQGSHPQTLNDLRNLGLTRFLSKCLEWIVIQWIWPYIGPYVSIDQLGGTKGCSTTHYLCLMIDYIYGNLDAKGANQKAVIAIMIDMSKAFNKINHAKLLTIFHDIGIPNCALKLLASYLTKRSMKVKHAGAMSDNIMLPGGGPQGGLFTMIMFNVYQNWLSSKCQPGVNLMDRFATDVRQVTALKDAKEQLKDNPPVFLTQNLS